MTQINEAKASVNLCNTITDVAENDDLSDGDLAAVSMPLLRVSQLHATRHAGACSPAHTGAHGIAGVFIHASCSSRAHRLCYCCRPS